MAAIAKMSDIDFFAIFFSNLPLFLMAMLLMTSLLYLSVRNTTLAGYFDPIHFYWTFTFGTAYGIIISLYVLGFIENYLFLMVSGYGILFIVSFRFFIQVLTNPFKKVIDLFLVPVDDGYVEFLFALVCYLLLILTIMWFVGLGMFAETNRFEQNRGFGAFVRLADALRLFVVAYISLLILNRYKKNGRPSFGAFLLIIFFILLIVLGAVVNGSKFALLESIYAIVLAVCIYREKPKFKVFAVVATFSVILGFALLVLSINLDKSGFDKDAGPAYMAGNSVLLERLLLRVLANADKYYFSLPGNVVDNLEVDSVIVRFISPLIGETQMSALLGYNVGDYGLGRQTIMYHYPSFDVAGGPTSHFDLFAYVFFGLGFGWIFVIFVSFVLSSLLLLTKTGKNNIFYSALVAAFWLRGLALLLEPPMGLAYVFDIFILFFIVKVFGLCVKSKIILNKDAL
ncbi:hypothetical protein [Polaromonas sp. DSR2-3-2]|uniref:hypothetical protein n=1 Tax=Polaromonas sp. DSR2-3-2 TaxID=2804622 RepID=UPI003CF08F6B